MHNCLGIEVQQIHTIKKRWGGGKEKREIETSVIQPVLGFFGKLSCDNT